MRRKTSAGEILQAPAQHLRLLREDLSSSIRAALPGIIVDFDKATQTATIQPAIMESLQRKMQPLPLLKDVPVLFLGGTQHALTYKVSEGDECLVVFADTAIDAWFRSGKVQPPVTPRRHSLSDGFALVGFRSRLRALPATAFPEPAPVLGAAEELMGVKTMVNGTWKTPFAVDSNGKVLIEGYYAITPENIRDLIEGDMPDIAPTVVKIDSSRGLVFKSNTESTDLNVSIYWFGQRITTLSVLRTIFGQSAVLRWEWMQSNQWVVVSDSHVSQDGFKFTVAASDIDDYLAIRCSLLQNGIQASSTDQISLADLTDGYSVNLTMNNAVLSGDPNGVLVPPIPSFTTQIYAYCGDELIPCSVNASSITFSDGIHGLSAENGLIAVVTSGNSPSITFVPNINLTSSRLDSWGNGVDIPVMIGSGADAVTIHKQLYISITNPAQIVQVGSRNLLQNTTDEVRTITDTLTFPTVDISGADAQWVTFHVHMDVDSGEWQSLIRLVPVPGSSLDPEEYIADVSADGWATVVVRIPSDDYLVQAEIEMLSVSGELDYHSPMLERGNVPTQWTPATEDVQDGIDSAQMTADGAASAADQVNTALQSYQSYTQVIFERLQESISMRVTETTFNALEQEINRQIGEINVRATAIEQSVDDIQTGIGTHFIVESDKIRITQTHNNQWEQQLLADKMQFVNATTQEVVASFGVDGGYAYKLHSDHELSVGTAEHGWYDMTVLDTGVADKWRSGTNTVLPAVITQEPVNCWVTWANGQHDTTGTTAWPESDMSFEIEAEDAVSYQWQYRRLNSGNDWANLSGEDADSLDLACSADTMNQEFRCLVTGADGVVKESRAVRAYITGAPVILIDPGDGDITTNTQVQVFAPGAASFDWQSKSTLDGSSWSLESTETTGKYTVTQTGKWMRCVVSDQTGLIAISRVWKVVS